MRYYRDLQPDETLQAGDERLCVVSLTWSPIAETAFGWQVVDSAPVYRRPVDAVPRPHWRTVDDVRGYVGDRIVAICQWSERHTRPAKPHVITLTIGGYDIRDNEDLGYYVEDCECWMPEVEFLRLFVPEVQQ